MNPIFKKLLIANRGENAVRIIRACRELTAKTIAVYSGADRAALHVKYADECYHIGLNPPIQSYLDINKIIKVAKDSASEAIEQRSKKDGQQSYGSQNNGMHANHL